MQSEVDEDPALQRLLLYLRDVRGFDFTGYKRSSLSRRITRRMQTIEAGSYAAYLEHLEANPAEMAGLFDTLLINVTSFFRDIDAWTYLATTIVPELIRRKRASDPIRIWSAGCASGEEPYSVAMLLAEALGLDEYVRRVKIYATDLDESALGFARRARYGAEQLEALPNELRSKYFQPEGSLFCLNGTLRRSVVFGRHDLIEDAPISHLDLLLCRNVLMYFNLNTQARVLSRLNFALEDHGFLFLGRAEMMLAHNEFFVPVELRHRVFRKQNSGTATDFMAARALPRLAPSPPETSSAFRLREAAMTTAPVAQIVLDAEGRVAFFNEAAAALFRLVRPDLGRPLQDLEVSYRPIELRSLIDLAHEQRGNVLREGVTCKMLDGETQYLDIAVVPLFEDGTLIGTSLTFTDVTHHQQLRDNLQRFGENLETAYEELQSANEELETTNEELQSSNEELETINEELQAASEEMETVNEELRSANEELQDANEQLRRQEAELHRSNMFLNSILGSLHAAVVVVDDALLVRVWNRSAEEFWGLRQAEVEGQSFLTLDIGLPLEPLSEPLRACLAETPQSADIPSLGGHDRRGRSLDCRVTLNPLEFEDDERGAIIVIEPLSKD